MSPSFQLTFLSTLIWGFAAWGLGTIAWLVFKHRKNINSATIAATLRCEQKNSAPKEVKNWDGQVKRFRRVGLAIWLTLLFLGIAFSIYNTSTRK